MFSIQKWKCSWSLFAAIASVVALVSVVHLFLFPLTPTFDYFKQVQNSCFPINGSAEAATDHVKESLRPPVNLKQKFPADLHKAVVYRGAPWKAKIGRWLSGCDSTAKEVNIVEVMRIILFFTFIVAHVHNFASWREGWGVSMLFMKFYEILSASLWFSFC